MSEGSVVAIDGKSLRGTYDKSKRNAVIHRVSAFSAENRLVLGQVKTGAKSNEITAIPEPAPVAGIKRVSGHAGCNGLPAYNRP